MWRVRRRPGFTRVRHTAPVTAPDADPSSADPSPGAPSLATIAREWGRIGCIGFGGPPAHIALLRKLCVDRSRMDQTRGVRGRHRRHEPAARAGVDAAVDLLRVATARAARSDHRWTVLHRARPDPDPGAGCPVPERSSAARGQGCGGRSRRSCRRRGRPRGVGPGAGELETSASTTPARQVGRVRGGRGRSHRRCRAVRGPGAARRGGRRGLRATGRHAERRGAFGAVRAGRAAGHGRAVRAGLDGDQGRCTVLRRWVRDHSADALRRRGPLPLDDRRAVPQCGRVGADHPRTRGADGRRRRLRGGRGRGRAAGRGDRASGRRSCSC